MMEVFINKEYTACVSGHRILRKDISNEKLKEVFCDLIKKGIDTFLIGMAIGFDTLCFKVLDKMKAEYNFRIIAVVPCENQAERFNAIQKKEYEDLLNKADEKIVLSKTYTPYCMQKRNMFMVDNSSYLVLYLRELSGGTKNTFDYAKTKNINIINI